jgi:hypothetical protein
MLMHAIVPLRTMTRKAAVILALPRPGWVAEIKA